MGGVTCQISVDKSSLTFFLQNPIVYPSMPHPPVKNLILFVGKLHGHMVEAVRAYESRHKVKFRIGYLLDKKTKLTDAQKKSLSEKADVIIVCDTTSSLDLQKALHPYHHELLAITCRGEDHIPMFARVIPHVPYLKTPSESSLLWATDKIWMRRRLRAHNRTISPQYTLVSDTKKSSLKKIARKIGFPAIVKPTGLAASRLVAIVYHEEELAKTLKTIFRKIKSVYQQTGYTHEPQVLVEQFMEGEMYSLDGYITSRGRAYWCPLVHIKTGRSIGFDDFFGYQQLTPTKLKKTSIETAEDAAKQAVHALGLRSTTVHVELMKTEDGWKIIELGPRVGGFRQMLYSLAYGINHTMNDILIRVPQKPIIPKKVLGFSIAMKFFAKHEGRLTKLSGIKKTKTLASFKKLYLHKKVGDICRYAKHGGSSVFDIILFNKDRSKLLADVRRLEQMVKIVTQ